MTESDHQRLAADVARDLTARNAAQDELHLTQERREERTSGFLGRKRETVTVHDRTSEPFGWRLWRQIVEEILWDMAMSPGNSNIQEDTRFYELWLRPDGTIEHLQIQQTNHPLSGTWTATIEERHAASAAELIAADQIWVEQEAPAHGAQKHRQTWRPSSEVARDDIVRTALERLRNGDA